jgi:hypothetical protein
MRFRVLLAASTSSPGFALPANNPNRGVVPQLFVIVQILVPQR